MTRDANGLAASLQNAITPQFRGRLLARGQAQSMVRRNGVLPDNAPQFGAFLDDDLLNYGYALISTGLLLLDAPDAQATEPGSDDAAARVQLAQSGFIQASYAIEAATRNAIPAEGIAFHRLIAGAASHLGGFAARAFSLTQTSVRAGRLTPMEATLADLVLRDLDAIEARAMRVRTSPDMTDDSLFAALIAEDDAGSSSGDEASDDANAIGPIGLVLSEHYLSAVSSCLFAIAYNLPGLLQSALDDLASGEVASQEISAPGPWWVYRLSRRLLGDLGQTSIRANIPIRRPPAAAILDVATATEERSWGYLRRTFVATLLARRRSEIDLWPSQLHVVDRIFSDTKDLVVALPTSAGKTRIAELCILACLAQGRRAVYVTPLRALSAQTERVLERTFTPVGARVSSLYGSMGASQVDEDALRTSEIVVATPEKLDFALRSDPTVLDDVGLIVLDEGHMIGPNEREIRYEAQVQRLLRREDADSRRIMCLSAVFPSGDELTDFVDWITDDEPDGLHREDWRPTRQTFGLVEWRGDHARLTITMGNDQPFIPRYFEAQAPTGRRRRLFPSGTRELVIATAWRLIGEGQTVLIFCPQRNWVEPYAEELLRLRKQGFINSVLPPDVDLSGALAVGAEWFGADHPILECLRLGVAIHHGALPGPFRREVERLLHDGVLRLTVASPTLAQGLNLSASVVLFHGLRRGSTLLTASEFANVIGRAGRAFVDTEGQVLYPVFEPTDWRRSQWLSLTTGDGGKTLRSGLIAVSIDLIRRMRAAVGLSDLQAFIEYLTGGPDWAFPVVLGDDSDIPLTTDQAWSSHLALLDTGLLSIVGDEEADPDQVTQLVADALRDSLWERQLNRLENHQAALALRELVASRARYVWSISTPAQRRGWYLAGLGAEAGSELGWVASDVVELTSQAEDAIQNADAAVASNRMVEIASIVFALNQFEPETDLLGWQSVLLHWLSGRPLGELGRDRMIVTQFVEADVVYRLVWGMEAARVYESAQGNATADALNGIAVSAIETGTLSRPASILIQSGFDYRSGAIAAVARTQASFDSSAAMRDWIRNLDPDLTQAPDWPTLESNAAWLEFTNRSDRASHTSWVRQQERVDSVNWYDSVPEQDAWLRVTYAGPGRIAVWSTGFDALGDAEIDINPNHQGVLHARPLHDGSAIELRYRGPRDLLTTRA